MLMSLSLHMHTVRDMLNRINESVLKMQKFVKFKMILYN